MLENGFIDFCMNLLATRTLGCCEVMFSSRTGDENLYMCIRPGNVGHQSFSSIKCCTLPEDIRIASHNMANFAVSSSVYCAVVAAFRR